jgi:glycosyltransferase involved in cell wall biosynthesis
VATEALAAGLPIVLSDAVGCAPDLLPQPDVGERVPSGDAEALAGALERQLDRRDRRTTLPAAARQRADAWGHDRCLRALVQALGDAGAGLPEAARAAVGVP